MGTLGPFLRRETRSTQGWTDLDSMTSPHPIHNTVLGLAAFMATLVVLSCDPCWGTSACRGPAEVSGEGQLIVHATGEPVAGVVLDFQRTGGVGLEEDVISVTTDSEGRYHFRVGAEAVGEAEFRVDVRPPGEGFPYTVEGVRLRASDVHGDGTEIGRWVVDPFLAFTGEARDRKTGKTPRWDWGWGKAVFKRTGGILIEPQSVTAPMDEGGRFYLAPNTQEFGEVVGDITFTHKDYPRPFVFSDVRIRTEYRDLPIELGGVFYLGGSLNYSGEIYRRGAPAPIPMDGYEVAFHRTGGITVSPATFQRPVQSWGGFSLATEPQGDGTVEGQLIVLPPPGFSRDTISLTMPTFDGSEQRLLGRWGVGPSLNYSGEVFLRSAGQQLPLEDIEVQFRRTGGIAVEPDTFSARTTSWGGFSLNTFAVEEGTLSGELLVRLPPPRGEQVIADVQIPTFKADDQRLLGRWGVGAQINYGGILYYLDTGEPVAGVEVRFIPTGGIAVQPDTLVQTTTSWGGFSIQLRTEEEGDVVGDLIVILPPPRSPVTLGGIHVPTFASDELRFLASFGI